MGAFLTRGKIENPGERDESAVLLRMLVNTGSEYVGSCGYPGKDDFPPAGM